MPAVVTRSIVALFVLVSVMVVAAPAAASDKVDYAPPVDAPINDPFRPPTSPYGPGNRGLEYATAPGTTVLASGDGTVTFSGVVAGRRWVTIRHADGIRTTYGPLDQIAVANGDQVGRGEVIGTSAGLLMLTARVGEAYIDPATLFGDGPPRVYLVPEPLDLPTESAGGGWSVPGLDALLSAVDWEYRHVSAAPAAVASLTPVPLIVDAVDALATWNDDRTHCTSASTAVPRPTGRRVAVLVGGLGSSSTSAAVQDVDTATLGYRSGDVVRFSYSGGRVPGDGRVASELTGVPVTDYAPGDTVGDLRVAGHRLAVLLLQAIAAAPESVPVDVIAHSQGGLVARLAVDELANSHPELLSRLGVVATLGTPHQGADLAEAVRAAAANPLNHVGLDAVQDAAGLPMSADDEAVRQLAPGSDLLDQLAAAGAPPGVTLVSIAARGDLVVPSPQAHLDGATNVIVPVAGLTAHDQLPGSTAATAEIGLAIAGRPPTCESAVDAVIDAVGGDLIHNLEHQLALAEGA
jgi:hypothetical protein